MNAIKFQGDMETRSRCEEPTVTVPKVCDYLHSNFSYHTEHHLFPNIHPKYYPLISGLIQRHFRSGTTASRSARRGRSC